MKVLVTGGAGFIGSHVVDALCAQGARVLVVDSLDQGVFRSVPSYLNPRAEYCFADLRHVVFDERFADVEAVVHLAALGGVTRAARDFANVLGANCSGTARLVDAARTWPGLKRIVHCSSFSIYGSNYVYECRQCGTRRDGSRRIEDLEAGRFEVYCSRCDAVATIVPITEAAPPNPLEGYGASKYMQELCLRGFDHAPVTTLRFSSVYGTRLRLDDGEATIIARIAGWIAAGERPKLFEDGLQIRDWVYVGDIVDAILRLIQVEQAPAAINVCTGVPTTLIDACSEIARAIRTSVSANVVGGFRAGDMRHCLGDPSTITAVLGRAPTPLSTGAGLAFGN